MDVVIESAKIKAVWELRMYILAPADRAGDHIIACKQYFTTLIMSMALVNMRVCVCPSVRRHMSTRWHMHESHVYTMGGCGKLYTLHSVALFGCSSVSTSLYVHRTL